MTPRMLTRRQVAILLSEASRRSGIRVAVVREYGMGELSARIVAACSEPRRFTAICREVDRSKRQVGTPLRRLVERGELERVSRGVYVARRTA